MQAVAPVSWRRLDAGAQLLVGSRLQVKSRTETLRRLLPGASDVFGLCERRRGSLLMVIFSAEGKEMPRQTATEYHCVHNGPRRAQARLIYELIVRTGDPDRGRPLFIFILE